MALRVFFLALAAATAFAQIRLEIDPAHRSKPISRRLFGKFTEHLGRNVYQGAWAQAVPNPEFAPLSRWPNQEALKRRLESPPVEGVAPFWVASGATAARHLREGIRDVQELTIGKSGGSLETTLYLPLHRTGGYQLTLKARSDQPTEARISVVTSSGRELGRVTLPITTVWSVLQRKIQLDRSAHAPGDASTLRLEFSGANTVSLSRLLLFPDDHLNGWEPEVVRFLREARLPLLRFPGGNFVSGYHWRDGVGPLDQRPALPNPAWNEVEWNHAGTDDWLRLCELTGAEPFICINAGNAGPEEARQWVEYVNGSATTPMGRLRAANGRIKPYNVRLWEVGNELYGNWQIGHTNGPGYAERYPRYVSAMRAADPNLLFIANGHDAAWNNAVVERNGALVRSISEHPLIGSNIAPESDPLEVWLGLVAFADGYLERLRSLVTEPMRRAGLEPKVAVTEMQIFTNRPSLPNNKTVAEALWLASLLHTSFRSDGLVELITHSALLNHGGGLGKNRSIVYAEPVWWATHLYSSQSGDVPVAVRLDSPVFSTSGKFITRRENVPYVDASALLDPKAKVLSVFLINRNPASAYTTSVSVPGAPSSALRATLAAKDLLARNTWDSPNAIRPQESEAVLASVSLPPLSLTRLTVKLNR